MKYTEEQEIAIQECLDYIHNPLDPRIHFTLTGSPGTGKTVSVRGILSKCTNRSIAAATISHVAKNLLEEHLSGLNINTMTIAQLLGAVPNMNKSQKSIEFSINPSLSRIKNYDLIVIDETSMIDTYTYNALLNYKNLNAKLVFIGDKNQLPPVAEKGEQSPTLTTIDAQLTKVMRFSGPISEVVEEAKAQIELFDAGKTANAHFINSKFGQRGRKSKMNGTTGYIFLDKVHDMFDLFVKEYMLDPNNINNTRILMFRKDYVSIANDVIRGRLYGKNLKQFEIGELIVNDGGFRSGQRPIVHNRETYKVREYREGRMKDGIPCIELILDPQPHGSAPIVTPSLLNGGIELYYEKLNEIKEKCKQTKQWKPLHMFKSQFSWWDYTYAQNLYLAQGKTYNSVFVVESEIQDVKPLKMKQRLQALYVGLSRAKERLYIYNKKYKADGSAYTNTKDFTELFNSGESRDI